jgi:Concanavalin A-like lectin/glucanases superfamily/Galactose oxidase-like, Early set domain/Bacterial Ig domain
MVCVGSSADDPVVRAGRIGSRRNPRLLISLAAACALSVLAIGAPARPASMSGLVAGYGFEEGNGASVADASGLGNGGTIAGATWGAGRYGNGLSFDGVNDIVTVPDSASLDFTTAMTIEAWVRPRSLVTWRSVILKERGSHLSYALYANSNTNTPTGHVYIGGDRSARGTSQIPLNSWSHLAVTYNGAALRLFVNGTQVGSRTQTGSIAASTGSLRIGANTVWPEWFDGVVDEVRLYNRALSVTEIQADMTTPVVDSPPSTDTTPPTVSIVAPSEGASVSGTVSMTASAADDVGVAGVRFEVNNTPIGTEDVTAPYSVSWDTGTTASGTKVLTAVARDAAGNTTTSAPISVTVTNAAADPAVVGRWEGPFNWPGVAVHAALLPNGKVLLIDGFAAALGTERLWDPQTGSFTAISHDRNLFCAGHGLLPDGRMFVAGGHVSAYAGISDGTIFDWQTNAWSRTPNMARSRWYPTVTTLADGRLLVLSGDNVTRDVPGQTPPFTNPSDTLPEVYDPAANAWTQLSGAQRRIPLYPFMFVLPDGRVVDAGPDTQTRVLNLTTQTWTSIATSPIDGHSAVMYRPGRILKSGTWADPDFDNLAVTNRAVVLDATQPSPTWREVAPMAFRRTYHTLTVLPDGTVLASGGSTTSDGTILANGVVPAEMWDPDAETWSNLAAMQVPRLYHSTSLLLPDGRVLVAGGGRASGATNQMSAEIFSPPYLFKGSRPAISSTQSGLTYGNQFTISTPDAGRIRGVNLLRLGSVTHSFDMNQRFVPLTFTSTQGHLQVDAPATGAIAPPGYYMLFIVDDAGVPSVATFVWLALAGVDGQPPTAPSGLTAQESSGTVSLSWTAATDNIAVTRYNVHRSTTSGFTPSVGNRIGSPTGTTFIDNGLPAGTYYYVVSAEDAAQNVSLPSTQASAIVSPGGDPVPPTVSLTAPSDGATVTGTVTVTANSSDNVGVVGVQFRVGAVNLGSEDSTAPYGLSWDTTSTPNGPKVITAVARDSAGNTTTSAAVNVVVSNSAPAPVGLVAAYGFEEGLGSAVTDISGRGNNGSISGATWTASGRFGYALSFDGDGDIVSVADSASLDLSNAMTLEAYVRPRSLPSTTWRSILMKERGSHLSYAMYANSSTNSPSGHVYISGDRSARGTSQIPLNTWTHLAVTYDGTVVRMFVDGVQVGTRAVTGSIAVSTGALRIGGNTVWPEWFDGLIDEVRIYSRVLSAEEIRSDMTVPIG